MTIPSVSLVFTAHKRPYYMRESLESWKQARGYQSLKRHVFVDPSPRRGEMLSVFAQGDPDLYVHINNEHYGVLGNPWHALNYAFEADKADFVILAEEDLVVTPDVLDYFAFTSMEYQPQEALAVCAYNKEPGNSLGRTFLREGFEVWIWGLWRENWYSKIRDTWDFDYSTNNGVPGIDAGWDHNITRISRQGHPCVYPEVTRSRHIGRLEGSHMQEHWFQTMQPATFDLDRPEEIEFYRE